MAVALEQFVKQLEDSGVLAPGKLENFVPPKAQPKDAQELARQLILSKQLTKFQVQEIYQGRAKSLILGNYTILDKIGAGGRRLQVANQRRHAGRRNQSARCRGAGIRRRGEKIEITQPSGKGSISFAVDPGKHRLKVEKDGFQFFAKDFEMESGGTASIKATLVEDKPWLKPAFLEWQSCGYSHVSNLTPLKGMPLTKLDCGETKVVDLLPLEGMKLTSISLTPKNITKGVDAIRQMKGLQTIGTGWEDQNKWPTIEFWKKYDAGEFGKPDSTAATPDRKPITKFNDPAFQQWRNTVAAKTAEQQVEAVAKKLQELNPGFDGKEVHKIERGVVTELSFYTVNVTDISPVRALVGLKSFGCGGGGQPGAGKLSDLSPLEGMGLTNLKCQNTRVSDLSPLKGMPLTELNLRQTLVVDLSPLRGMRSLANLGFEYSPVSDLSPLEGMALTVLDCESTQVTDLSPLRGMHLGTIAFTPKNITKGIEAIRGIKSLASIGTDWDHLLPTAEFWKKYDAGDFGK
jgi:hypothetical protein